MSGHSKWSQIKHQKGVADAKKGQLFSKFSKLISIAAKTGADPANNPSLAAVIERARAANMPKDNIERAVKRAGEKDAATIQELTVQALGPGNVGIVITAVTDNRNRTLGDIKTILAKHGTKMAGEGSLNYLFDRVMTPEGLEWRAKFPAAVEEKTKVALETLFEELGTHDDVENIFSNLP